MKRLRYVRHSDKAGDFISAEGLERARKEVPEGQYTDAFYGPIYRTLQTLAAAIGGLIGGMMSCEIKVHQPVEEIGTTDLFAEMATPEFKAAVSSGFSNFEAVDEVHLWEKVHGWEVNAAKCVAWMFSEMDDGGFGLAYGHDPLISLAARYLGFKDARSLKTLEYIDFIEDGGMISVGGINVKAETVDGEHHDPTFGF